MHGKTDVHFVFFQRSHVFMTSTKNWPKIDPPTLPSKCAQNLATTILQMLHIHILITTPFTWPTSTQNIFISISLECTFLQKLPILGILHFTYYGLTEFLEPITYQTTIKFNGKFYQRQKFFPTSICSNKVLLQQKLLYRNSC